MNALESTARFLGTSAGILTNTVKDVAWVSAGAGLVVTDAIVKILPIKTYKSRPIIHNY